MIWTSVRTTKPPDLRLIFNVATRCLSSRIEDGTVQIKDKVFQRDHMTNVTPKILSHLDRNLHLQKQHPLCLTKQNIVNYMYAKYSHHRGTSHRGLPVFSVHDQISPVVTLEQNFDNLLVPKDHVSRKKSDSYYVDSGHMLRAHTSAHQSDLIKMGLDNFLVVGDVYRRDEIDATHYPVFHQVEGVRLIDQQMAPGVQLFESGDREPGKQGVHTLDAARLVEADLKECLLGLAKHLFGDKIQYRWVDCYFPFTHPSWELEVLHNGDWLEVLGCGVMEQEILYSAGVQDKVGWAFGLGLERLAMVLYGIPDIRLFWSTDTGFLSQFSAASPDTRVLYKAHSKFPQCTNDLSFWLPAKETEEDLFSPNDFYDLVRDVGGDIVEQVRLVDEFTHPKTGRTSQCYRIVYRHMSKTLTQAEANKTHKCIEEAAVQNLDVTIR